MTLTAMQERASDLTALLEQLSDRDLLKVEGIIIGIGLAREGGDSVKRAQDVQGSA